MPTIKFNKPETKTTTVEVTPAQYVLTLSELEAQALKALLGTVSGYYKGPLRTQLTPIWAALGNAGVVVPKELRDDLITNPVTKPDPNYYTSW